MAEKAKQNVWPRQKPWTVINCEDANENCAACTREKPSNSACYKKGVYVPRNWVARAAAAAQTHSLPQLCF